MNHLLIITSSYPIDCTGSSAAGSFVSDVATALSKNCQISVIAPGNEGRTEHISKRLTIYRYKTSGKPLSSLLNTSPFRSLFDIISVLYEGRKISREVINAEEISHIFALWALPCGWWAKSAAKLYSTPYSVWALGSDIWTLGKIPLVRGALKNILNNADHLYADGIQLAKQVEELSKTRKCEFLPSTRAHDITFPSGNRNTLPPYKLSFVGRWHTNKGIDILLDSFIELDDFYWNNIDVLTIAGGGNLEEIVKEKINTLTDMNRNVELVGYLEKHETMSLFENSDIALLPSRIESVPLVLTDIVTTGIPVIAMPVGDLEYIISKYELGYLASEVTVDAYKSAIEMALKNYQPIKEYRRDEYLKAFSFDNTIKKILSLTYKKNHEQNPPHI